MCCPSLQWVVRPVVESHGWDHEAGIESFSLEKAFVVKNSIPANISGQIAKDKKDANLTIETEASVKHSDKLVTTSGLDIQTVGKQLAYTLRSETRWKNLPNNKTAGGVSASYVAGAVALGAKLEDRCVCAATCEALLPRVLTQACVLLRQVEGPPRLQAGAQLRRHHLQGGHCVWCAPLAHSSSPLKPPPRGSPASRSW